MGRALADGSTGQPVTYFDGRQLYGTGYLPAGYRLYQNTPWLDTWVIAQPKSWRGYSVGAGVRSPWFLPDGTVNVQVSQVKPASVVARLGTGRYGSERRSTGIPPSPSPTLSCCAPQGPCIAEVIQPGRAGSRYLCR